MFDYRGYFTNLEVTDPFERKIDDFIAFLEGRSWATEEGEAMDLVLAGHMNKLWIRILETYNTHKDPELVKLAAKVLFALQEDRS